MYIRTLELFGLANVKKISPTITLVADKTRCDQDTLHAVVMNRYEVLTKYARSLKHTCRDELAHLKTRAVSIDRGIVKRWLHNEEHKLSAKDRERLTEVLIDSETLHTVHSIRQDLAALWQRSNSSTKEQLIRQLENWCQRAEVSGIVALRDFSRRLRRYQLVSA